MRSDFLTARGLVDVSHNLERTTGYSPYQLVFGKEPIFPIEFEIQTLRIAQEVVLDLTEAQINRLQQINELDEIRLLAIQHIALIQQQRAK